MVEPLRIPGASPRNLLGYLVGLGLLRVVARDGDPASRACWCDGALELHSRLDAEALEELLLDRWVPAPVVSPWNGGSGFFPPKKNVEVIEAIETDRSPRLVPFRAAIAAARHALQKAGLESQPEPKVAKPALLRELRATLPDAAIEWLDAAIVLVGDGIESPPVLGSGGNDGNFEIANNYAQAVVFALAVGGDERARRDSAAALSSALWRIPGTLCEGSLAHLTRDASPVNSPAGMSAALRNPWELALAIEGTLVLAAGAGRRLEDGAPLKLVAPFTLPPMGAGYGSAVADEKGRAELWLPLWNAPATVTEVEELFREARMRVGRSTARTALEGARAAAELGVARGIVAFERFSILNRAGTDTLAVPAGRVEIRERPAARALHTLDPWLGRVVRHGSSKGVPQAQREAIRRLERAAFAVAQHGTPADVRALLVALGRVETLLSRAAEYNRPKRLNPIAPPAAPWIAGLDCASFEVRLAVSLASVADAGTTYLLRLPALRDYLHATGYDDRGRRRYGSTVTGGVPAMAGVIDRLAAAHERRHQDAARAGRPELGFDRGIGAALSDLTQMIDGQVDERSLGALVDGLALLDYRNAAMPSRPKAAPAVDPLLGILVLAFHDPRPAAATDGTPLPRCRPRPDWVSRLRAGRVRDVVADALLRLRLAELPPIADLDDLQTGAAAGGRLAAALLAHPDRGDARRVAAGATLAPTTPERQETTQ